MSQFEKMVKESGWKIIKMEVVEEREPIAELFNMDGRIEEYTIEKEGGVIEKVRIANL